jgi:type I restriction enzyme R subunit
VPRRIDSNYRFDDEVALEYYRLQKISEGSIKLAIGEKAPIAGPISVGTGIERDVKIKLSKLIDILNERFGTTFKLGDQLFFDSIKEDAMANPNLQQAAMVNTLENFGYVFRKAVEELFIDRMDQNEEITAKFLNEKQFRDVVIQVLMEQIYNNIRTKQSTRAK